MSAPTAAPARFPYLDHRTCAQVADEPIVKARITRSDRLPITAKRAARRHAERSSGDAA